MYISSITSLKAVEFGSSVHEWNISNVKITGHAFFATMTLFFRCQLAKSNWRVSEITSRTFVRHENVDDVTYSANVT